MMNEIDTEKVAILLTTYNPCVLSLSFNISTYIQQCGKIYLVDNSPNPFEYSLLPSSIEIISLRENKGIAMAQNIAYEAAKNDGYNFFIEIDQDSKLSENYVYDIFYEYTKIVEAHGPILGVGPVAISETQGLDYYGYGALEIPIPVEHTLSSGFFYSSQAVEVCGLKNENLFIDLVDWEWCMRGKSSGLPSFVTPNVKILHSLGEGHKVIGPFKIGVPKPFRHYYQFRNTILLSSMKHIPIYWKLKNILKIIFKMFIYPILLDEGKSRLRFMIKGIFDGFKNKTAQLG
ncbi:TPA: hypothetical protein ACGU4U_001496 [Vibrio vulnificus]|nr:hypothetical protein [Vibrio vulnificus]ELC9717437.1 hypothetical protein [Vibrio vulnificus]ELS0762143.1 hypothetical protein [Vibrio vulnificus]ELV8618380.1 hypothetical protein [Vibrio vulnificus]